MVLIKFLVALFIVALALNFGWEISQMPLYETAAFSKLTPSSYTLFVHEHWIMALKDSLVTVALYLLVAIVMRNAGWGRKFNNKRLMSLLALGLLWGIGIEYHAVFVAHRWAYTADMPILPIIKVGAAPVLQMLIVPLLAILLTRKQLSEK